MSVTDELRLEQWEVLEEERGEVSIFSEVQKILHVEGVDTIFGIVFDHLIRDEEGFMGIRSSDTVKGETTWKTSDGTE